MGGGDASSVKFNDALQTSFIEGGDEEEEAEEAFPKQQLTLN